MISPSSRILLPFQSYNWLAILRCTHLARHCTVHHTPLLFPLRTPSQSRELSGLVFSAWLSWPSSVCMSPARKLHLLSESCTGQSISQWNFECQTRDSATLPQWFSHREFWHAEAVSEYYLWSRSKPVQHETRLSSWFSVGQWQWPPSGTTSCQWPATAATRMAAPNTNPDSLCLRASVPLSCDRTPIWNPYSSCHRLSSSCPRNSTASRFPFL